MRNTGVYLLEVELGALRYKNLPAGNILFTLRIGKSSTSICVSPLEQNKFAGILQLNVDSSALEAQRCSLSLNLDNPSDKRLLGIALITLPKDKSSLTNSYKLSQSHDRQAQIDLKIRVGPLDGSNIKNSSSNQLQQESKGDNPSSMSIKVKSKHSGGSGEGQSKKIPKNYKIIQENHDNGTEKEMKRYKAEKEAYYQMYQIEKAKNEVASKFINGVIRKLTQKYPNLVPQVQASTLMPDIKKRGNQIPKNRNPADAATIQQLEQANKSLHRQVTEYKQVVEQLKQQLSAYSKPHQFNNSRLNPNNRKSPLGFFDFGPPRNNSKDKSNIIPSYLKDNHEPAQVAKDLKEAIAGVNLKEWLDKSIAQRDALQAKLTNQALLQPQKHESKAALLKKIRSGIDKTFSQFLSKSDFSKKALLAHKQQVNKVLDDYISW